MTLSKHARDRSNAIVKVVATARSILTYQVGLPVGVTRLRRALYGLQPFEPIRHPVFDEYMTAVSGLPIGSERLEWSYDVIREKDKELETINARFRDRVFDSSRDLLDRFAEEADEVRKRDRAASTKPGIT